MAFDEELARYVERHFVDGATFLKCAAIDEDFFRALLDGAAIPGAIYHLWENGSFWSPIGGNVGIAAEAEGRAWFSPAAIWWARRAKTMTRALGLSVAEITARFQVGFCEEFAFSLVTVPNARLGYPNLFSGETVDRVKADATAIS